jgi:hypothetical protein
MTRLLKYINEFWTDAYGFKFEVLENPSVKEIIKLVGKNQVRFTLYKKDLWVWQADKAIHMYVWNSSGKPRDEYFKTDMNTALHGIARLQGGKYVMSDSDEINAYIRNKENDYIDVKNQNTDLNKVYKLFKGNKIINIVKYFKDKVFE